MQHRWQLAEATKGAIYGTRQKTVEVYVRDLVPAEATIKHFRLQDLKSLSSEISHQSHNNGCRPPKRRRVLGKEGNFMSEIYRCKLQVNQRKKGTKTVLKGEKMLQRQVCA